jgi:hypothetical protein
MTHLGVRRVSPFENPGLFPTLHCPVRTTLRSRKRVIPIILSLAKITRLAVLGIHLVQLTRKVVGSLLALLLLCHIEALHRCRRGFRGVLKPPVRHQPPITQNHSQVLVIAGK